MSEKTPQYPIGKFHAPESVSPENRSRYIETIASAPARLRAAVKGISATQLDTPYREGGWTPRQVVHHVPESHMNAYIRFKLALTETDPVIKPYDEAAWARLADVAVAPIEASLVLLESLHLRWVVLMRGLSGDDWGKRFIHPEYGQARTLEQTLALYAWHGDHHIAHVKSVVGKS
jgi:hypothetical protein